MKAHLIEVLVIDHEGFGDESCAEMLATNRYLNASPIFMRSADIGDWSDAHPLNHNNTSVAEIRAIFCAPAEPEKE